MYNKFIVRGIEVDKDELYTQERYDSAIGTMDTYMSNFEQLRVPSVDEHGNEYWNSEGHYMALRTDDLEVKKQIAANSKFGGMESRRSRKKYTLEQDEFKRVEYMFICVKTKFDNNPELRQRLIDETGDKEIIEKNWWHDILFGVYVKTMKGANILGKSLMMVRSGEL